MILLHILGAMAIISSPVLLPVIMCSRIWRFRVFLSWWWPFRQDDAATLTAMALDADIGEWTWQRAQVYFGTGTYINETIGAKVKIPDEGRATVNDAETTLWGDYRLRVAIARKNRREERKRLKAARYDATREISDRMRRLDPAKLL